MGCIQAKASLIGQHDCHLAVSYFNPCVLEYCFSVSLVSVLAILELSPCNLLCGLDIGVFTYNIELI